MNGRDITLPAVLAVLALVLTGLLAGYATAGGDDQSVTPARTGPAPVGAGTQPSTIGLPAVGVPATLKPRVKPRPTPTNTTTTTAPVQTVPTPEQPESPSRGKKFDSVG